MYGISRTKMINPAQIVSIDYQVDAVADSDGKQTGMVIIQMSNQASQLAHTIKNTCDECERIITELIKIVKGINADTRSDDDNGYGFVIPMSPN